MKIRWKTLLLCVAVPLATGIFASILTGDAMKEFNSLNKPALSPPAWLFPVVWTALYILMGIASYLVLTADAPEKNKAAALKVYAAQLIFNFFWSIIFFGFEAYLFAFIWLVALWALIAATIFLFNGVSKPASYLMLPYLLWVSFAGYLNLSIYLLNR